MYPIFKLVYYNNIDIHLQGRNRHFLRYNKSNNSDYLFSNYEQACSNNISNDSVVDRAIQNISACKTCMTYVMTFASMTTAKR